MEKKKFEMVGMLVDVVLKGGETLVGYIENSKLKKDEDFINLNNKKITKGMRYKAKRIKKTDIVSVEASKEKASNF